MQDDNGIKGPIKGEQEKQGIQRVKDGMLRVGKERMPRELIGGPEGEISLPYTFHPEEPGRNEIRPQIPFG